MKIGMTGARHGVTHRQAVSFLNWFKSQYDATGVNEFHHGDCVGADEQITKLVKKFYPGVEIHCHPPKNPTYRAFVPADITYEEKDYLIRNRHIVDCTDKLVAFPDKPEVLRSGTWSTIRYGKRAGSKVLIFNTDGQVVK
jgi:hypothetical protein